MNSLSKREKNATYLVHELLIKERGECDFISGWWWVVMDNWVVVVRPCNDQLLCSVEWTVTQRQVH
jgi:hypothetical protein